MTSSMRNVASCWSCMRVGWGVWRLVARFWASFHSSAMVDWKMTFVVIEEAAVVESTGVDVDDGVRCKLSESDGDGRCGMDGVLMIYLLARCAGLLRVDGLGTAGISPSETPCCSMKVRHSLRSDETAACV